VSRIVVIDSSEECARLAAKILERGSNEMLTAQTGLTGLSLIRDTQPDLVLVNLSLPDIDGQQLVFAIREFQVGRGHMPVIAYLSLPSDKAQEIASACGCDGVITKPIDTRAFADQISDYLPTEAFSQG